MNKSNLKTAEVIASVVFTIVCPTLVGCGTAAPQSGQKGQQTVSAEPAKPETAPASKNNVSEKTGSLGKSEETIAETAVQPAPKQPKSPSIYQTDISGKDLIAAAVRKAQRDHKHILIEWGGNWCGWCHRLHDVFLKDEVVRPIVFEEFELVLIDSNTNQELLREYGGKDRQFSYPHLTILDAEGKVLTNQNTEPLEEGRGHSSKVVAEFLSKWKPGKIDAEALLSEKLKQATDQNKRVFFQVGTPYCGWCKVLSRFMQDHEEVFAKEFVIAKVDTMRMTNGAEVAARYLPKGMQGDPWFLVLDAEGKSLASSLGPNGNIGYPGEAEGITHFMQLLRETRQTLSDAELDLIFTDLESWRIEREKKISSQKETL